MKNIAFKRAKNSPMVKDSLHPDFITEYADTTLFPEGFHKPEDGYEIMSEDQFNEDLAKNEERHQEFQEELKKRQEIEFRTRQAQDAIKAAEDRKAKREYEEFLKWKKESKR